jgi:hypothetical protein
VYLTRIGVILVYVSVLIMVIVNFLCIRVVTYSSTTTRRTIKEVLPEPFKASKGSLCVTQALQKTCCCADQVIDLARAHIKTVECGVDPQDL